MARKPLLKPYEGHYSYLGTVLFIQIMQRESNEVRTLAQWLTLLEKHKGRYVNLGI